MRIFLLMLFVFACNITGKAQNFNYQLTTQQDQSFVLLSDSVKSITDSAVWDDNTYQISIGFSFAFAGQTFDSLKIRTNGTLTFDNNNNYNFVALYKNFICELNSSNYSLSPITKELTTLSDGTKRLKIEFQNATFIAANGSKRYVNFQIWLNQQNNSIEFHMGATDASVLNESCIIGLLDMNGGPDSSLGYILQGSPTAPTGGVVNGGGDISQLSSIPAAGSVYIFSIN